VNTYLPKHSGPCAKAHVVATLVTQDGQQFESTNFCLTPQSVCPREEQGYKSGEGYHLCKTICNQAGHAEENVIFFARKKGANVRGSTIDVEYSWICENCKRVAKDWDVEVKIKEKNEYVLLDCCSNIG